MSNNIDLDTCHRLAITSDDGARVGYLVTDVDSPDTLSCRTCGHHVLNIDCEIIQQGFVDDLHILFVNCQRCRTRCAYRYYLGFEGETDHEN